MSKTIKKDPLVMRAYRLPPDVLEAIAATAESTSLPDVEIVKRAIRMLARHAQRERGVVVCDDATRPFWRPPA